MPLTFRFIIVSLLIASGFLSVIQAEILHVPDTYELIQTAIDSSADEDTVLIAPGVYHERINFNGKSIVVGSYLLTTGNDAYIRQTVIDGDSLGTVVTFAEGSDERTVLSGLTIQNGGYVQDGGGIYCSGASPTLEYLIIQNCTARNGAAAYVISSDVVFRYSTIIHNSGGYDGGINATTGYYSHLNFLFNTGVSFWSSGEVTVEDCFFENNDGVGTRGVVYSQRSGGTFRRLIIRNNEGAGISCSRDSSYFQDILVYNNCGGGCGGARFGASTTYFYRALFFNNSATDDRMASTLKFDSESDITLVNVNVIAGENPGAALIWFNGNVWPVFVNSIIDRNQDDLFAFWLSPGASVTFANCCFSDSNYIGMRRGDHLDWAEGNIISDPGFIDRDWSDYRLRDDSPCIDAGTRQFFRDGVALVDIQEDQYSGLAPDIGWFEFDFPSFLEPPRPQPARFNLYANYPNPFNASTTISFDILTPSFVKLNVYDINGRKISTLIEGALRDGRHSIQWNAQDVASGTYFINLESAEESAIRPITFVK